MTHTDDFPHFSDWLALHSDNSIQQLLERNNTSYRYRRITSYEDLSTPHYSLSPHSFTLDNFSAAHLALLHAAYSLNAHSNPITIDTLLHELQYLFEENKTRVEHRPSEKDNYPLIADLIHHAFFYGPEVHLNISASDLNADYQIMGTPFLHTTFSADTATPWCRIDYYSCPIPSTELAAHIAALDPKQQRILRTLSQGGWIGHSESVRPGADPTKPLPAMVKAGLLDQINDNTVRLSGRVERCLEGGLIPDPGGDFRPIKPVNADSSALEDYKPTEAEKERENAAQDSAVAMSIDTIQDLEKLLTYISTSPLPPLSNTGVGHRELTKMAKNLGWSLPHTAHLVRMAAHAALVGYEVDVRALWGTTEIARTFLQSDTAQQWSILLQGWFRSPWESLSPRTTEAPLLSSDRYSTTYVALRHHLLSILLYLSSSSPTHADTEAPDAEAPSKEEQGIDNSDLEALLWRSCPHIARHITPSLCHALLEELLSIGVLIRHPQHRNRFILIKPVIRILSSLREAKDEKALGTYLSELLPDQASFFIIQADYTITVPGLLSVEMGTRLRTMATLESHGIASVWRITNSTLHHAYAQGLSPEEITLFLTAHSMGLPQGLEYLIEDSWRSYDPQSHSPISDSASVSSPSSLFLPNLPHNEKPDPESYKSWIHSFRQSYILSHEDEEDLVIYRDIGDMVQALKTAYAEDSLAHITFVESNGRARQEWLNVITVGAYSFTLYEPQTQDSFRIHLHRIASVGIAKRKG